MSGPNFGQGRGNNVDHSNFDGSGVQIGDKTRQTNNRYSFKSGLGPVAVIALMATAAAALVGGTTLAVKLTAVRDGRAQDSARTPGTSESTTAVVPPQTDVPSPSATRTSAPSTVASDAIRWRGDLRLGVSGMKLDPVPPAQTDDSMSSDIGLSIINGPVVYGSAVALWSDGRMPSRQECAETVSTQATPYVGVEKGSIICVRTHAGRIAVLTIASTPDDILTGTLAHATVWSDIPDPG